ncbi:MAG: type II secretion system protein GspE, partial [Candidatus Binatia bacterium]
ELLQMTEQVKGLVMTKASAHEIQQAARKAGMRRLGEDGLAKVLAGVTSLEEVLRVTRLTQDA